MLRGKAWLFCEKRKSKTKGKLRGGWQNKKKKKKEERSRFFERMEK